MAKSYYYLVASLPDIILDGTKKGLTFVDFIDEIAEQIAPEDLSLLRLLQLPYDNKNCITLLEKSSKDFLPQGMFSREMLEEELKFPELIPAYMQRFIEAVKEEKLPYPECSLEDQLNWLFYEELAAHQNLFIRDWFTFDLNVRNVLAGLNCRKQKDTENFSLSTLIVGRNEVSQSILKSNAPDFSLSNQIPWIDKIVSSSGDDLVTYEKNIDTLRWDMLNELTVFTYFQIETILAFCLKLDMVERWQQLDPETGKERLGRLLEELKTGFTTD